MTGSGSVIHVKVSAGAKTESVEQTGEFHFHIRVREKAEQGRANERAIEVLRDYFGARSVCLLRGSRQPNKLFEIISN